MSVNSESTTTTRDEIILVDENDRCIGFSAKLDAHERGGMLHRAFSIFIFNADSQMLIQQRAAQKYHFGERWTNACCSHPRPGEDVQSAAHRRLQEEFGFNTELHHLFSFIYRAEDDASGLTEYELDHVFMGQFNGQPHPDPDEIATWQWVQVNALRLDVQNHPERYTPWFRHILDRVLQKMDS